MPRKLTGDKVREREAHIWKTLAKHPEGLYLAELSQLMGLTAPLLHKTLPAMAGVRRVLAAGGGGGSRCSRTGTASECRWGTGHATAWRGSDNLVEVRTETVFR